MSKSRGEATRKLFARRSMQTCTPALGRKEIPELSIPAIKRPQKVTRWLVTYSHRNPNKSSACLHFHFPWTVCWTSVWLSVWPNFASFSPCITKSKNYVCGIKIDFIFRHINTKFDNNWPSTFEDYLSDKNLGRETDGQTDRRKEETYFFVLLVSWKVEKT